MHLAAMKVRFATLLRRVAEWADPTPEPSNANSGWSNVTFEYTAPPGALSVSPFLVVGSSTSAQFFVDPGGASWQYP